MRKEQFGSATLYLGDNRDILPTLPAGTIDLVFTSPPYNLGNTTGGGFPERFGHYRKSSGLSGRGGGGTTGYDTYDDNMPHEEYVAWQHEMLNECWRLLTENGAIFYNHKSRILDGILVPPMNYIPENLLKFVRQEIIWKRSGGINFSPAFYLPMHERVLIIAKRNWRLTSQGASGVGDVWEIHQEINNPHPAPFPIGLPATAIETAAPASVFDPFLGSGTTGIAALQANKSFIGIEQDPDFFEMACRRIEAASKQDSLF